MFFSVGSELDPAGTQAATVSCLATEGQYVYFEDTLVNTTPVLAIDSDCVDPTPFDGRYLRLSLTGDELLQPFTYDYVTKFIFSFSSFGVI